MYETYLSRAGYNVPFGWRKLVRNLILPYSRMVGKVKRKQEFMLFPTVLTRIETQATPFWI